MNTQKQHKKTYIHHPQRPFRKIGFCRQTPKGVCLYNQKPSGYNNTHAHVLRLHRCSHMAMGFLGGTPPRGDAVWLFPSAPRSPGVQIGSLLSALGISHV